MQPIRGQSQVSSANSSPIGSVAKVDRRQSQSSTGVASPAASAFLDAVGKNSPSGEGMLQTFFSSLLNRKSVGSSAAGGTGSTSGRLSGVSASNSASSTAAESLRACDVHAELDRIIEGTKSSVVNLNSDEQQS